MIWIARLCGVLVASYYLFMTVGLGILSPEDTIPETAPITWVAVIAALSVAFAWRAPRLEQDVPDERLPIRRFVVLQELPPHVLARVDPIEYRIDDPGGAVHDVQWRVEAMLLALSLGELERVLVRRPARID